MVISSLSAALLTLSFPKTSWSYSGLGRLHSLVQGLGKSTRPKTPGPRVHHGVHLFPGCFLLGHPLHALLRSPQRPDQYLHAGPDGPVSGPVSGGLRITLGFISGRWSLLLDLGASPLGRVGVPRSILLSGFPWALVGYSQYKLLPLIQVAEYTGVYGISFLSYHNKSSYFINFF